MLVLMSVVWPNVWVCPIEVFKIAEGGRLIQARAALVFQNISEIPDVMPPIPGMRSETTPADIGPHSDHAIPRDASEPRRWGRLIS